jgi:hypothetical protein
VSKPQKMVEFVPLRKNAAVGLRQFASEFEAMANDECFDFNDSNAVNDLLKLCRYIKRNVKVK